MRLIEYRASFINPAHYHWQTKLNMLMERYYKNDTRTNVRIKTLKVLSNVIKINRFVWNFYQFLSEFFQCKSIDLISFSCRFRYEDELIERIFVPQFQHVEMDSDVKIRNKVAQLLVELCLECETKLCLELLDILEKVCSHVKIFSFIFNHVYLHKIFF